MLLARALVIYGCKKTDDGGTDGFCDLAFTTKNSLSIGLTLFLYFTGYFWVELLRGFDVQVQWKISSL